MHHWYNMFTTIFWLTPPFLHMFILFMLLCYHHIFTTTYIPWKTKTYLYNDYCTTILCYVYIHRSCMVLYNIAQYLHHRLLEKTIIAYGVIYYSTYSHAPQVSIITGIYIIAHGIYYYSTWNFTAKIIAHSLHHKNIPMWIL